MKTESFKYPEPISKRQKKELVNEAAERLAEIFIMQIESEKNKKKTHGKETKEKI